MSSPVAETDQDLVGPAGPRARARRGPTPRRRPRRTLVAVVAVLVLLVPPVLAALVSATRPTVHAVQSDVIYRSPATDSTQALDRELATQQVVMAGRPALTAAAGVAGLDATDLAEDVSVEVVEGSSVLRLEVHDIDPDRALRVAQSLVDGYVEGVRAQVTAGISDVEERELIEARIAEATDRLAAVDARLAQIAGAPEPVPPVLRAEERRLSEESQVLRQQISNLEAQLTQVDVRALQVTTAGAQVLTPPYVVDEPVGPQPLRAAAAGLLVGAVLSAGSVAAARAWQQRGTAPA